MPKCRHNNSIVIFIEHAQSSGLFIASCSTLNISGHKLCIFANYAQTQFGRRLKKDRDIETEDKPHMGGVW